MNLWPAARTLMIVRLGSSLVLVMLATACSKGASLEVPADPCQWLTGSEFRLEVDALGLGEEDTAHLRGWIARKMYVDTYQGGTTVAQAVAEAEHEGWRITVEPTDQREFAKQIHAVTGLGVVDMVALQPKCPGTGG